ncbi:MAG: acyl-CoA synthetase [Thaumarchaeota archaeon]|nr:acyl-CoA synthetase [Nitrososphaerota archaeon]
MTNSPYGKLGYETYEEACEKYTPKDKWSVFDGEPSNFNITHECIDRHTDKGAAILIGKEDGGRETITFKGLGKHASQFANLLEHQHLTKGDRVAIFTEPCLELYVSMFGSFKHGACIVLCSPLLGKEAIRFRLEDSKPKLIIAAHDIFKMLPEDATENVLSTDDLLNKIEGESDTYETSTSASDAAAIQYTSGTTGNPKPFVYRHKSLASLAPGAKFSHGVAIDDVYFCPSSVGWGHFLWPGTCAPLIFGATASTRSGRFVPERILEMMREFRINNTTITPTAVRKLLDAGKTNHHEVNLEKMTYTGEPLDQKSFFLWQEIFGVEPHAIYGSTEVGAVISDYPGFKNWKVKQGSLGKPFPALKVAIIDSEGKITGPQKIGEIAVHLRTDWKHMGDSGYVDTDGYYWFTGRMDDIIKSSGYRIGPVEIENVLNSHYAVKESAAIGVPDAMKGHIIKAFVVLKEGQEPGELLKIGIQQFVREKLAAYAYPKEIEFTSEIPKTIDGKVKRNLLRLQSSKTVVN